MDGSALLAAVALKSSEPAFWGEKVWCISVGKKKVLKMKARYEQHLHVNRKRRKATPTAGGKVFFTFLRRILVLSCSILFHRLVHPVQVLPSCGSCADASFACHFCTQDFGSTVCFVSFGLHFNFHQEAKHQQTRRSRSMAMYYMYYTCTRMHPHVSARTLCLHSLTDRHSMAQHRLQEVALPLRPGWS